MTKKLLGDSKEDLRLMIKEFKELENISKFGLGKVYHSIHGTMARWISQLCFSARGRRKEKLQNKISN